MKFRLPRVRITCVMIVVAILAIAFASLRFASSRWTGAIVLLTLGILCWAVLAAVYRRESARAFWIGFALFGSLYMGLTAGVWWQDVSERSDLPTSRAMAAIFPYLDDDLPANGGFLFTFGGTHGVERPFFDNLIRDPDAPNRRIRAMLEKPVPMPFAQETPLEDVIKHIQTSTGTQTSPAGIPIYLDPVGFQMAEKTPQSLVTLAMDGIPLRVTLKLILDQLEMIYLVEDGVVRITFHPNEEPIIVPRAFHRIGHCWFAWLAGLIGGWVAVFLRATGMQKVAPNPSPTGV